MNVKNRHKEIPSGATIFSFLKDSPVSSPSPLPENFRKNSDYIKKKFMEWI